MLTQQPLGVDTILTGIFEITPGADLSGKALVLARRSVVWVRWSKERNGALQQAAVSNALACSTRIEGDRTIRVTDTPRKVRLSMRRMQGLASDVKRFRSDSDVTLARRAGLGEAVALGCSRRYCFCLKAAARLDADRGGPSSRPARATILGQWA